MPNPERAAKLSAALAKGFGEDFTFMARAFAGGDVNMPRAADLDRTDFTATGVFAGGAKERKLNTLGRAVEHRFPIISAGPRASFEDAAMPWTPVEGDLCARIDTGETFAVARTLPDGFGRTLVYFTAKKR